MLLVILGVLLAFEVFNFSTTEFALHDFLGDLHFVGMRWSMILSVAFCGIDFAGVVRLFTPEKGADKPLEVWYLFGAWLLAAAMNAMLAWWGVSIAILNNETLGNAVVARDTMLKVMPIFVALLVWLVRVLVIGYVICNCSCENRKVSLGNNPQYGEKTSRRFFGKQLSGRSLAI